MYGYIIERSGVPWAKRVWFDIPAVSARGFGNDTGARVFFSKEEASVVSKNLNNDLGIYTTVVKRSDLYPPQI